jgi:hypothetical protein
MFQPKAAAELDGLLDPAPPDKWRPKVIGKREIGVWGATERNAELGITFLISSSS